MSLLGILSIVAHTVSLVACIRFLRAGSARNEDIAVLAGIAFSCATFIFVQAFHLATVLTTENYKPLPLESVLTGFFLLNGIVYFSVVHAFQYKRLSRRQPASAESVGRGK